MAETIEGMFNLAMLEELFGKFDFLGIIDTLRIIETYKIYITMGEVRIGILILLLGLLAFAVRVALLVLLIVFVLRVWRIVAHHYFKIIDGEKDMQIKKEFFARQDDGIEVSVVVPEEKSEVVEFDYIEETEEIEIPVQMDATKEVEIPKRIEEAKENKTLKEKVVSFLFNE